MIRHLQNVCRTRTTTLLATNVLQQQSLLSHHKPTVKYWNHWVQQHSFVAAASAQKSRKTQSQSTSASASSSESPVLSSYTRRHIGPQAHERQHMLQTIGVESVDALLSEVIPSHIRMTDKFSLPDPCEDYEALAELQSKMDTNQIFRSYIGTGYYNTHTPKVILRNILENPSWYTPYTPYQAEIAQGRLEMLLNFQTMVGSLVGKPLCNSSLLDESTACAEAMTMCLNFEKKTTLNKPTFLVSDKVHPQNISVVRTRAEPMDIRVQLVSDAQEMIRLLKSAAAGEDSDAGDIFGVLVQYPDTQGSVGDYRELSEVAHSHKCSVVAATDLMACALLTPPGEWGADIVVGSAQRFGVPLGFGGPHAGFLATDDAHVRKMPGRIIGVTEDSRGKGAYRMALQVREQHIRREKATSNLCTAQALLANVSAAYGIFHGPEGIREIAGSIHGKASLLFNGLQSILHNNRSTGPGFEVVNENHLFFDTLCVRTHSDSAKQALVEAAHKRQINFRTLFSADDHGDDSGALLGISVDETTSAQDIDDILQVFASVCSADGFDTAFVSDSAHASHDHFVRTSPFMQHEVFGMYHSETAMMRYLYALERKDLGLNTAMIPLGSCTMKLNSANVMVPLTWPTVSNLHPFAPEPQTRGYLSLVADMERWLAEVTGFDSVSLQPNSGANGEYTGLLCIREYHKQRNEHLLRNVCLIPTSAHGTNPASAAMAGWRIVTVKCDHEGNIDMDHLTALATEHSERLAAIMITYPSTHGVFEDRVCEVIDVVHRNGGLVYMDGANLQAQLCNTTPGLIGADVCHLNLHKTFCIPHGGGGPGLGPIGVAKHLTPFLPKHDVIPSCTRNVATAIGAVAAAPYSSASILVIPWMYMRMMGEPGLREATESAIVNANYMASRLDAYWPILYRRHGRCAHEFIIDVRPLKESLKIGAEDIAKRLMDYGFHAPTMSWPVTDTLMVEPTESEPLSELDRLCDALISIRQEITEIENGSIALADSALRNSPHTIDTVMADDWNRKYSRTTAAVNPSKGYWPSVGRVDNVGGDRNLQCSCPPMSYWE